MRANSWMTAVVTAVVIAGLLNAGVGVARAAASAVAANETSAAKAAPVAKPKPTPPPQPPSGPGGSKYTHEDVAISSHLEGGRKYHLFQPAGPRPAKAPVIVFVHGWGAIHPVAYGKWIEHLVRRGNIVIYPHYQGSLLTLSSEFVPNALASVQDALKVLEEDGRVKPDLNRFALVGHSAGGLLAANLAALAKEKKLPAPKALMVVQPGVSKLFPLENMKAIPSTTLLLAVVGDADRVTYDTDAKNIFRATTQIDKKNKNFVILRSDFYGMPRLWASHMTPVAVGGKGIDLKAATKYQIRAILERGSDSVNMKGGAQRVGDDESIMSDALDYYGCWKLFDGLTDAAFHGKNRKYALGDTPEQRFMGKWSDGRPVKELVIVDEP